MCFCVSIAPPVRSLTRSAPCASARVQIQILLYFLLVSLPKDRAGPSSEDAGTAIADSLPLPPSLSPSKSKKRKHKDRGRSRAQDPPPQLLEERLESYMDKLAMWQLMQAVDSSLGRRGGTSQSAIGKEKQKQKDDRDWMQVFCEDMVEPLFVLDVRCVMKAALTCSGHRFKAKLPELCALFRSKLFPDAGNSDTDSLGLSPPLSPKPATKRLKSSASASASASSSRAASKPAMKGKDKDTMRSRSNSLALSLEQEKRERERSRSLSLGPNGLRKRAIIPEVTMTTKFGKARAKQKAELERTASVPGPSLSRTQSQQAASGASTQDAKRVQRTGSVLVAATPTKPRDGTSKSQSQSQRTRVQSQSQTRLPSLFAGPSTSAWAPSRLSSQTTLTRVDSLNIDTDDDDDDGGDGGLVATPTKARRKLTLLQVSEDRENDMEGNEWRLGNLSRTLSLGVSNSQERPESEGDVPPISSSPGDLGGFGEAITPPRRGATQLGGQIMVEDTPTKS